MQALARTARGEVLWVDAGKANIGCLYPPGHGCGGLCGLLLPWVGLFLGGAEIRFVQRGQRQGPWDWDCVAKWSIVAYPGIRVCSVRMMNRIINLLSNNESYIAATYYYVLNLAPNSTTNGVAHKFLHTFLPTVALSGNSDEDEDYTSALPPDLTASRAARPSLPSKSESNTPLPKRHYVGPSLPHSQALYDDGSYLDVGPQPLPTAYASQIEEKSGVEEFLERDERRRQLQEETSKMKKLQREEWMLVPPQSGDLLASLDPTKARPRQFARSAASVVAVFVCTRIMCVGAGVPRLLTIRNASFTKPRCNPDITE
ncbi:uncharacterized protein F5891DRAFT_984775 [Suillus fuscotomentosus]|uniref:Uncharacterized protein n=1 Tax=Suillus fuscotomentosus TaxID=1912939 RepID=A0AAD4DW72_9AGAM|nr:uncharacterized protein F5891DRAFT_984775 [Suillus fuscotomentosus]KAG1894752.1 hypothetical protein F5891DRAFT_984775 [Suillus fuscotomentosus]